MLGLKEIRYSLQALSASKGRTFLTMLGVLIGVTSVIAVSSIGLSAQQLVLGQVQTIGSNLVVVIPGASEQANGPPPIAMGVVVTTLKRPDVDAIRDLPHVVSASAYVLGNETVSYRDRTFSVQTFGTEETVPKIENMSIDEGRYFSAREVAGFARVVVLGSKIATDLFPDGGAVGKTIRIKDADFQVIGTVKPRGSAFVFNQDDQIMMPVTTVQRLIAGSNYVNAARIKVEDEKYIPQVKADVKKLLLKRHNIKDPGKADFTIESTDVVLSVLGSVTDVITWFLLAVTAISLLVGGVNIMNVMFVAVRERTKEIGLRKAIGATGKRILTQFVIESAIISFLGGLVGIVVGIAMAYGIAAIIKALGYDWTFILPLNGIWQAVLVATLVGIAFGIYPAWKAAKADPIEALRYE